MQINGRPDGKPDERCHYPPVLKEKETNYKKHLIHIYYLFPPRYADSENVY